MAMFRAVLIKSQERFESFRQKLLEYNVEYTVLDFSDPIWIDHDFSNYDFLIYYPSFEFSSNFPQTLYRVHDNIHFIQSQYPNLVIYPDPKIIWYYNDKYRQFLFLQKHGFPIPATIPLTSESAVDRAARELGFPLVVKNRHGAGGDFVFLVKDRKELYRNYYVSQFNFIHASVMKYFYALLSKRVFYYHLIKAKRMTYPFLTPPLLAQKFLKIDRDLKTVVGDDRVMEGHWRFQATKEQWKVNIDGGGVGQWSKIPDQAMDLSLRLARALNASWLNLDIMESNEGYLISEFSPVWHHYRYKEKPSFVYKDDYNINIPLEVSLDLERIIVESLINRVESRGSTRL
jgi:glutathione synthase/RimK-type ligase-like ATP-grasp enzyme